MSTKDKAINAVIATAKEAIRKDRSVLYELKEPWELLLAENAPADYDGEFVRIHGNKLTILPNRNCDGATMSPDKIGKWSMVVPALAHDALYEELEPIAAAWEWPVARTRKWADDVFYGLAIRYAPSLLARIYWRGIRLFGGIAHAVGKVLAVVLVCLLVAGWCGGCGTPNDPLAPGPHQEPVYERIDR